MAAGFAFSPPSCMGISLVMLYCMSTLYHAITNTRQPRRVLRVFDRCSIFLLIAGSYAPFTCSLRLRGTTGYCTVLCRSGALPICRHCTQFYRAYGSLLSFPFGLYVLMGWAVIDRYQAPASYALPAIGFYLLIGGGLMYMHRPYFLSGANGNTHTRSGMCSCLSGSLLHFFSIMLYVY